MTGFFAVIIAILILLIMITVHEFGHYVAGKIFKFKINEFAIGMGPAIYKKTRKNGEVFSVRALPLGGFCAFEGEDENNPDPNAFNNKKPWQRIIVLISGALMNFLLALFVIILMFSVYGKNVYKFVEIDTSSSYNYTLESEDVILEVNGKSMLLTTDFTEALDGRKKGDIVSFKVLRDGKIQTVPVELREDTAPSDDSLNSKMASIYIALGVETFARIEATQTSSFKSGDFLLYRYDLAPIRGERVDEKNISYEQLMEKGERISTPNELIAALKLYTEGQYAYFYTIPTEGENPQPASMEIALPSDWDTLQVKERDEIFSAFGIKATFYFRTDAVSYKAPFFQRFGESFIYSFKIGGTIFQTLGQLLTGKLGLESMGGPVTTISTTSKIVTQGFNYLLEIMAFIGVNLAVFNLLPIPALDGSRVIFTLIEWIFRKPVPKKIEGVIHAVGLIFLLGFSILVDVLQLM